MKIEVIKNADEAFEPVYLKLKIETFEEFSVLWNCANRSDLCKILSKKQDEDDLELPIDDTENYLFDLWEILNEIAEKRGYL